MEDVQGSDPPSQLASTAEGLHSHTLILRSRRSSSRREMSSVSLSFLTCPPVANHTPVCCACCCVDVLLGNDGESTQPSVKKHAYCSSFPSCRIRFDRYKGQPYNTPAGKVCQACYDKSRGKAASSPSPPSAPPRSHKRQTQSDPGEKRRQTLTCEHEHMQSRRSLYGQYIRILPPSSLPPLPLSMRHTLADLRSSLLLLPPPLPPPLLPHDSRAETTMNNSRNIFYY
jgi:hypothetical protein